MTSLQYISYFFPSGQMKKPKFHSKPLSQSSSHISFNLSFHFSYNNRILHYCKSYYFREWIFHFVEPIYHSTTKKPLLRFSSSAFLLLSLWKTCISENQIFMYHSSTWKDVNANTTLSFFGIEYLDDENLSEYDKWKMADLDLSISWNHL